MLLQRMLMEVTLSAFGNCTDRILFMRNAGMRLTKLNAMNFDYNAHHDIEINDSVSKFGVFVILILHFAFWLVNHFSYIVWLRPADVLPVGVVAHV